MLALTEMGAAVDVYAEWMSIRGFADSTIRDRRQRLRRLVAWLDERAVTTPPQVTPAIVERYQRWLYQRRKPDGAPLSVLTQHMHLVAVRGLFRCLVKLRRLAVDPSADLDLPKLGMWLPKAVLNADEAEQVLSQPNVKTALGMRDRAILETLYSTGIRRSELRGLRVVDVDFSRGVVTVRRGKGNKDRVVPIGERALAWIRRYLDEARAELGRAGATAESALFLPARADRMSTERLSQLVRTYVDAAHLGKHGSCHLFRHTMATLMLEGGADVRYVQEMLGHAKLTSTQIYTRVSIVKLKEVHAATHPSAKLRKPPADE